MLHRVLGDSLDFVRYDEFDVLESTKVWIEVSDTSLTYPLYEDYDNDGIADFIHYPGGVVTEVSQSDRLPATGLQLLTNQPNPFNPVTEVRYEVPAAGHVTLAIYDVSGRLVTTLVDAPTPAGSHAALWDGRDSTGQPVASGVYFARLKAGERVTTRKIALVK